MDLLRFLAHIWPKSKTELEIVLNRIEKQDEVRSASITMYGNGGIKEIDISEDLHFMVGKSYTLFGPIFRYFRIKFGDNDNKCIVTTDNNDILFIFDKAAEIRQIRRAVMRKYSDMVANKLEQNR